MMMHEIMMTHENKRTNKSKKGIFLGRYNRHDQKLIVFVFLAVFVSYCP
jgi:hypothetical protein